MAKNTHQMIYNLKKKIMFELSGKTVHLRTKCSTLKGNVLISYITLPFLTNSDILDGHTNRFECLEMTNIFLTRGYNVDVIDWTNKKFLPKKDYKYFIDIHDNLERISPYLNNDCLKILHITTSHWKFQNEAEMKRLDDLEKRRGIRLLPRRQLGHSLGIETADIATMLGNNVTKKTYGHVTKKIYQIPVSTTHTFRYPASKDFSFAKKNFIWLGGSGMVHKGLDLVLEAFAQMPEYHLSIFGNVAGEKDFAEFYKKELLHTKNITLFGKIDPGGEVFERITGESIAIINPSCSEGQSGAVITAMHAGLIPIISKESGVDCLDFGTILPYSNVETIKTAIKETANSTNSVLMEKSKKSWQYVNSNHTRESFSRTYNDFVDILEGK